MQIDIRLGTKEDIESLGVLYDELNDYLAENVNYPGWIKGIYPTREDAELGILEECLFVAMIKGEIAGSVILRKKQDKAYKGISWQGDFGDNEVLVIYTFVVNPRYLNKGIGKYLLEFAESYGKYKNLQAIRLDVYENNIPAIKLYEKMGYKYIDTISLGLEVHGLDFFKLYEKLI